MSESNEFIEKKMLEFEREKYDVMTKIFHAIDEGDTKAFREAQKERKEIEDKQRKLLGMPSEEEMLEEGKRKAEFFASALRDMSTALRESAEEDLKRARVLRFVGILLHALATFGFTYVSLQIILRFMK